MSVEATVFRQDEDFVDLYDLDSRLNKRFGKNWEQRKKLIVIGEEKD